MEVTDFGYMDAQSNTMLSAKADTSYVNTNFYTQTATDGLLANKADTTYVNNNFYTETETNALLNNKADLTNGAQSITASQITTALDITTDIQCQSIKPRLVNQDLVIKHFANNSVLTYDHTNDKLVVGKALDSAGVYNQKQHL